MIDFHTHRLNATDAIVSLTATQTPDDIIASHPHGHFSVGLHPWDTASDADFDAIACLATLPQVVAIGETGLDKLRGASLDVQTTLFERHIELSESLGKPLIIHCVKAWEQLIALQRRHRPTMPWGIHGFRGNPELARQLIARGFYLSLGEHFNPATAAIIPADSLLIETDESSLPISEIATRVNALRPCPAPFASTLSTFLNGIGE